MKQIVSHLNRAGVQSLSHQKKHNVHLFGPAFSDILLGILHTSQALYLIFWTYTFIAVELITLQMVSLHL
jgi:hypothetical protein